MDKEGVGDIHNGISLASKKNEALSFVTIWMDLDIIAQVNCKGKSHIYVYQNRQNINS